MLTRIRQQQYLPAAAVAGLFGFRAQSWCVARSALHSDSVMGRTSRVIVDHSFSVAIATNMNNSPCVPPYPRH